jgi:pyruvate ferredoxin oxidoreductase delta subunit
MKERRRVMEPDVKWKEITRAGIIYDAGNAEDFETGSWRSMKPVFHPEKCKQCMVCFFMCPDSSIEMKDGKVVGRDYDHCKGCGVCVDSCPFDVYDFIKDE